MPKSSLVVVAATALALAASGCGASGGTSCSGDVCTVQSNGDQTFELDQLGTKVSVSDLQPGSVRVRINADSALVQRGAQVRLRGFLVSAPETARERVKVRIER